MSLPHTLKLLTYNVGLLDITLAGRTLFRFTPFIEERLAMLPEHLLGLDPDVVALQEIYALHHKRALCDRVRTRYPHVVFEPGNGGPGVGNGMILISRYPISEARFDRFRDGFFLERHFARMGVFTAMIRPEAHEPFLVANVHTTAGAYWTHPEAPRSDRLRARQIRHMLSLVEERWAGHRFLLGDFNCGPGVSEPNYRQIVEAGYVDVYHELHAGTAAARDVTWDPQNKLNRQSPHRLCPPQRIDHVFVPGQTRSSVRIEAAEIVLTEPVVPTRSGPVTISDHFGLLATLRWEASE